MPQQQESEEMMTAKQAIAAFIAAGLSEPTFRRRVRAGFIDSNLPDGKQRGALFPASQVYDLIEREKTKHDVPEKPKPKLQVKSTTFVKATTDDMPEIAEVLQANFGVYPDIARWSSWMEKNPDIGYAIKCDGRIVGCGFIMPHSEPKILSILEREVTPPTHPEEVLPYDPSIPVCLYIRSVAALPDSDTNPTQKRVWGEVLMLGIVNTIIRLGEMGVVIDKIYGRSDTRMGERIMRTMGFTQIPTITSHKNFMIDASTSGLATILRYRRALTSWQAKYSGE